MGHLVDKKTVTTKRAVVYVKCQAASHLCAEHRGARHCLHMRSGAQMSSASPPLPHAHSKLALPQNHCEAAVIILILELWKRKLTDMEQPAQGHL